MSGALERVCDGVAVLVVAPIWEYDRERTWVEDRWRAWLVRWRRQGQRV